MSFESAEEAIEAQRDKAKFVYQEDISPGLKLEMSLKQITLSTSSKFQKIDVIETFFGKVRTVVVVGSITENLSL